ncbi:MAG: GNAT family N-acetyltransferase [Gammaproteobacteria bacterium]|nr:GNAT family N-acetyltransferase [Gammaproteobacteria bacterium]MYJ52452.1 GNAT family N-acetyltransferase [Gammaproteobacteria bacterium]
MNTPKNHINELGLEIGFEVRGWNGAARPERAALEGRYCRCEPLDIDRHSEELFEAFGEDTDARIWVYLPYGPFDDLESFRQWIREECLSSDPMYHAIVNLDSGRAEGVASYLRIKPEPGSIEVGHINLSPTLQSTAAATEAMYLMMRNAFELGYRRYEWKCNALNRKSCQAALRLGFAYEGIFRQMLVVKGRNRDTAWYSILDREWPDIRQCFERWLEPDNFDERGRQRMRLSDLTGKVREDG